MSAGYGGCVSRKLRPAPIEPERSEPEEEAEEIDLSGKSTRRDYSQRAYDVVREATTRHEDDENA